MAMKIFEKLRQTLAKSASLDNEDKLHGRMTANQDKKKKKGFNYKKKQIGGLGGS